MIKYSISKHNQLSELKGKDVYVLWKENKTKYGNGIRGIYQGTKQECEDELKKIKENRI